MRNIILFLKKYFTFFLFLFLEGVCISFLVKYNDSYAAAYSNVFNEYVGRLQRRYNDVEYFFNLKSTNKALVDENTRLRNALSASIYAMDSLNTDSTRVLRDSLLRDTSGARIYQQFSYLPAKVVNNSLSLENNYITLQKGTSDGIAVDMAVTSPEGVVGKVVSVSSNFSIVMGLLNHNSRISAMLLNNKTTGTITWDGKSPDVIELKEIPRIIPVKKGDTIVTSNISPNFPTGLIIGTVSAVKKDPTSSFHKLEVKPGVSFRSLQYAYIIKNQLFTEQRALEDAMKLKEIQATGGVPKR